MTRLNWTPKDPDEIDRFGIDWLPLLEGGSVAESEWSFVTAAGLSRVSDEHDGRFAIIMLQGGADGEIGVLQNRIVADDGRELEQTKRLPIISTASVAASGFTVPTPAQMIVQLPTFADVDAEALRFALDEAATKVTPDWKEADYRRGILLYAAHSLTLDGHGTGTEAELQREGLGEFQSIRTGGLAVSRFDRRGVPSGLEATSWGRRYKALLRLNTGGPRVLRRTCAPGC